MRAIFLVSGMASCSAMTLLATKLVLSKASLKSAARNRTCGEPASARWFKRWARRLRHCRRRGGEPPNRQGTALFNQGIDLLNHDIASKTLSGVKLELAHRKRQRRSGRRTGRVFGWGDPASPVAPQAGPGRQGVATRRMTRGMNGWRPPRNWRRPNGAFGPGKTTARNGTQAPV